MKVVVAAEDRLQRAVSLAVVLEERADGYVSILAPDGVTHTVGPEVEVDRVLLWRLPLPVAVAMNDALSEHLVGYRITDAKLLRDDLLHERGRVDRLIGAIINREA